jgi:hypothetical protein
VQARDGLKHPSPRTKARGLDSHTIAIMAKKPAQPRLSSLAEKVLADHRRAPEVPFYDLFSLGTLFDTAAVAQLDEAYLELEDRGLLMRVPGDFVRFGGNLRHKFCIPPQSGKAGKVA